MVDRGLVNTAKPKRPAMEEAYKLVTARLDVLEAENRALRACEAENRALRARLSIYEDVALAFMDVEESSRGTKRKSPTTTTTSTAAEDLEDQEDVVEPTLAQSDASASSASPKEKTKRKKKTSSESTRPDDSRPTQTRPETGQSDETLPETDRMDETRPETGQREHTGLLDEPRPETGRSGDDLPVEARPGTGQTSVAKSKIPDVILHSKQKWTALAGAFAARGINFTKAKTVTEGIRVQAASISDYRAMTAYLDQQGVAYNSYTLDSERTIRVVIRGLPDDVPETEILQELQQQGIPAIKVSRMTSRRTKRDLPLYLVEAPQKTTITVTRLCGLVVKVEAPYKTKEVQQCHRCQRFNHTQRNCRAPPKCVKCAGEHLTKDCTVKDRSQPPRCINCINSGKVPEGEAGHTANYRGCRCFPKRKAHGNPVAAAPSAAGQVQKTATPDNRQSPPAGPSTPKPRKAEASPGKRRAYAAVAKPVAKPVAQPPVTQPVQLDQTHLIADLVTKLSEITKLLVTSLPQLCAPVTN